MTTTGDFYYVRGFGGAAHHHPFQSCTGEQLYLFHARVDRVCSVFSRWLITKDLNTALSETKLSETERLGVTHFIASFKLQSDSASLGMVFSPEVSTFQRIPFAVTNFVAGVCMRDFFKTEHGKTIEVCEENMRLAINLFHCEDGIYAFFGRAFGDAEVAEMMRACGYQPGQGVVIPYVVSIWFDKDEMPDVHVFRKNTQTSHLFTTLAMLYSCFLTNREHTVLEGLVSQNVIQLAQSVVNAFASGEPVRSVAARHGISVPVVRNIVTAHEYNNWVQELKL